MRRSRTSTSIRRRLPSRSTAFTPRPRRPRRSRSTISISSVEQNGRRAMILIESVVGNINDASWKTKLEGATVDRLNLDQWQAPKNRFRLSSEGGVELAVSLERNSHLHDGDILVWDAAARKAIVAHIQLQEV